MQSNFDSLVLVLFILYDIFFMKSEVVEDREESPLKCHLEAVLTPIFRLVPGDLHG